MFFFNSFNLLLGSFIVGAIIAFIVGSLWYADFAFGKIWRKSLGLKDQELNDPAYRHKLKQAMIVVPVLFGLFGSIFVALFHSLTFASLWHTVWSSLVLWFGFICIPQLISMNYKPKTSWSMFLIDMGMYLVLFVIFAVVAYLSMPLWYM